MLSNKAKYGLKALLVLARESGRGPVLVAELARREAIPKKFLEAILLELKRSQVVASRKGKGGGYFLRRPPDDVTFGEVIRVLDGPLAAVPCVSRTAYMPCAECPDEQTCGVRLAMKKVRDASARILDNMSLVDVNRKLAHARKSIVRARRASPASAKAPARLAEAERRRLRAPQRGASGGGASRAGNRR